jgi:hypothetical protein
MEADTRNGGKNPLPIRFSFDLRITLRLYGVILHNIWGIRPKSYYHYIEQGILGATGARIGFTSFHQGGAGFRCGLPFLPNAIADRKQIGPRLTMAMNR